MKGEIIRQLNFTGSNVSVRASCPAGRQWRLISGEAVCVTDATVATRYYGIEALDADAGAVIWCGGYQSQAASITNKVELGGGPPSTGLLGSTRQFISVPADPICFGGDMVGITIGSGQAGDSVVMRLRIAESAGVPPAVTAITP